MTTRIGELDESVTSFLGRYLAHCPNYHEYVIALWRCYLSLGLPNEHFVTEFTGGKRETFFQRLWEMLLARHLDAQGHNITSSAHGPDFRFALGGRVIWVEAISPEPRNIPRDWLEPPQPNSSSVGDVPHTDIGLRWTAAFKAKWDKLCEYRKAGIVDKNDAYVIAINGCQLSSIPFDHGASRYPLALETVFPIGPLAFAVNVETGMLGQAAVTQRFSIRNRNGSPVPTTPFIDPTYSGVSAILAFSRDRSPSPSLSGFIVHNPIACVRVPFGVLGRDCEEWYADPVGTEGVEFDILRRT
jgi:hypothetical protein